MKASKRLFVLDVGRRVMATTHLRMKGGKVLSSPIELFKHQDTEMEAIPKPDRGEGVLVSLRDEFFEFFDFELPPAPPRELRPIVAHRCRQQATPETIVGAKLAGKVQDARGLPKQRLVVARTQRERMEWILKGLNLGKNRFLGVVPRSELVLSTINMAALDIPDVEKAFCVMGLSVGILALYFFRGKEFLFARHVALQQELDAKDVAQRVTVELVQSNLYLTQRYRLESDHVFFAIGEEYGKGVLDEVSKGVGQEVVDLCSVAEPRFFKRPSPQELLLGSSLWMMNRPPHDRLLILPPEVKQFYRAQRVSTILLTSAGALLVGSVLWGLGMSARIHNLKKEKMQVESRLLIDKGRVKALEKRFTNRELWKTLRGFGEVNPGSPPEHRVLDVLSQAAIPEVLITSCNVKVEKGGLQVEIDGRATSAVSYLDALKKGRLFMERLREGLGEVWKGANSEEVSLSPVVKRSRQGEKAGPTAYYVSFHAVFLLPGGGA